MSGSIYKKAKPQVRPADLDDTETEARKELSELQKSFRERDKAEQRRRLLATDSEFWVAMCFPSREAKEAFLREFGLLKFGDKYLNGEKCAEVLRRARK